MKILLRESQINGLIEDLEMANGGDNYYYPDLKILSINEFIYPQSHYYAGVKAVRYIVGDEKPLGEFRIGHMAYVAPGFDLYEETPRNWHRCISMLGEALKDFVNNHYKPQTIVFAPDGEMQRKRYQSPELINFIMSYIGDMYSSQVDGRNTIFSLKRMNEQVADYVDDAVDVVSAGLDTIPEVGNLASMGIDVVHGAAYAYRWFNAKTDLEKIEYGVMTIITLVGAFYPVIGNEINLTARGGIKAFVRRTPEEILRLAQKLGLYNKKIWPMQKTKWSFNMGLFLFKVSRGQIINYVTPLYNKIKEMLILVKGTPLEKPLMQINDSLEDINNNREIYTKIAQHV